MSRKRAILLLVLLLAAGGGTYAYRRMGTPALVLTGIVTTNDVIVSPQIAGQIADALGRIFSEIQAVNSVFASVSLPTSVNTEGTYLNQVYMGVFRPDANVGPRWYGNLKEYKLAYDTGNQSLTLVD